MASRRGFLGLLGGAAVAGPAAAKSVVSPLVDAGSGMVPPMSSAFGMQVGANAVYGVERRIEKLSRRISGVKMPWEVEEDRIAWGGVLRHARRYEVDGLRSVSTQHKAFMIAKKDFERDEERSVFWLMKELKQLTGEWKED
jgi:hypothetical protein